MAKRTKADLLRENEELTRKLVENNIIKIPTMMDEIEAVEAEATKTIEFIIAETEKKTGRTFVFAPAFYSIPNKPTKAICKHPHGCYYKEFEEA